jgi:protein-S-isoprenylcysteine O-methyltransferase Ste14
MGHESAIPASRAVRSILLNSAGCALLLFIPAGTLQWWRGWVIVGLYFLGLSASYAGLARDHQDLLNERMKPVIQKDQPLADKILLLVLLAAFYAFQAFIPLDVFHLRLLPRPGRIVSSMGLVLLAVGWCIVYLSFRENAFAAAVVKHQAERAHKVIDTGVYRIVRHPMYAGLILFMVGLALWLESYAGALVAAVPVAVLIIRIVIEERFLIRHLEGYDDYRQRVRHRLIPFIW